MRPTAHGVRVELFGIGTDLCSVERMTRELAREQGGFRDAVFTAAEIAWCSGGPHPAGRFAAGFAAKEAVFKALAPAGVRAPAWREIEVIGGASGEPQVRLHGGTGAAAAGRGVEQVRVSLSHAAGVATAVAVALARRSRPRG